MSDPRPTATYAHGDPVGGFLLALEASQPTSYL